MSKYNLTIYSLSRYPVKRLVPFAVAGLALLMMPHPVWSWVSQWLVWSVLIVSAVTVVVAMRYHHPVVSQQYSLDEQGIMLRTAIDSRPVDGHPYVIDDHSRFTALAIYLLLRPARGSVVHQWIFRSQCSERDYRRLCRMVSRMSRQAREKT